MKFNRISAVFKKQLKDTFKNKAVLIQFILMPLITLILTYSIGSNMPDLPTNYFVVMFSTMYIGMAPLVSASAIIAEEKEKNTLRVLIMSNVKPLEYLAALSIYIILACIAGLAIFASVANFSAPELLRYILVMIIGIFPSLLAGSAIGLIAKNQMSATTLSVPLMMVFSFLPLISMFNSSVETASKFVFTQQLYYLVNDLSAENFTFDKFAIIGANIVVFVVFFIYAFRKGKMAEQ